MRSLPPAGPRYWAALCLASVLGCNTGDVVADNLGLGHWRGLPLLAAAFAAILVAERRAARPSEAYYWLAIIVIRTAATNLADLAAHDERLSSPLVMLALAALLAAFVPREGGVRHDPPAADFWFWAGMLAAGTLGTVAGDDLAFGRHLGLDAAAALTTAALLVAVLARSRLALPVIVTFWTAVVVIRTWGTNIGDLLAHALGLTSSTLITGIAMTVLLTAWREP